MTWIPLEKQILDHLGHFIRANKHASTKEEQACISQYDYSPIKYAVANFALWSVFTLRLHLRLLTQNELRCSLLKTGELSDITR